MYEEKSEQVPLRYFAIARTQPKYEAGFKAVIAKEVVVVRNNWRVFMLESPMITSKPVIGLRKGAVGFFHIIPVAVEDHEMTGGAPITVKAHEIEGFPVIDREIF